MNNYNKNICNICTLFLHMFYILLITGCSIIHTKDNNGISLEEFNKLKFKIISDSGTVLTKENIRNLLKYKGTMDLNEFHSISLEAAVEIVKHNQDIRLNGIKKLSPQAANILAKHKSSISLNGLKTISASVAGELGKHSSFVNTAEPLVDFDDSYQNKHVFLSLTGLREISPSVAKKLAMHKRELYLDGLVSAKVNVLKYLSKHTSLLSLRGLQYITEQSAYYLGANSKCVDLSGVKSINRQIARGLSNVYWINLSGLKTISNDALKALCNGPKFLNLSGLVKLNLSQAKIISKYFSGYRLQLKGISFNTLPIMVKNSLKGKHRFIDFKDAY